MTNHPLGFNEEQVEALWASAEHWLENWQDVKNASSSGVDCACCEEFYSEQYLEGKYEYIPLGPCSGCPIAEYIENDECRGTPWSNAAEAITSYRGSFNTMTEEEVQGKVEKEYRFLVSLALGEKP